MQNPMIHQNAVDEAAAEVQAILQGERPGQARRTPPGGSFRPPTDSFRPPAGGGPPAPPPGMGPGPRQSPGMGPGASPSMGGYPSPAPSTPQHLPALTTQCWVSIQAPPDFNLPQRLRGPGSVMPCFPALGIRPSHSNGLRQCVVAAILSNFVVDMWCVVTGVWFQK